MQRPLGFVSWRGNSSVWGREQGAPHRGAARAKKPRMKPCRPINAAGRPFLSSNPSRSAPKSRHPRATQTGGGGGDRAKPAQRVASLRARKTGNRQRLAGPRKQSPSSLFPRPDQSGSPVPKLPRPAQRRAGRT